MNIDTLIAEVRSAGEKAGIVITDQVHFEASPARIVPFPSRLESVLQVLLQQSYGDGLYNHQALSLDAFFDGSDVCVATPTASGKSLIFMTAAAHAILQGSSNRVLAIYPAKALIQDQVQKWKALLDPLKISVGFIDGSVPGDHRFRILNDSQLVLMTPDVVHAWLMSKLGQADVNRFIANLSLVVLDEAHVYSGVFGSNMAYLLRRLQSVSRHHQIISSTATIWEPEEFIRSLTGRTPVIFNEAEDGAGKQNRSVILAEPSGDSFTQLVRFVVELSRSGIGTFIAFADSRRMVETFVAATRRQEFKEDHDDSDEEVHVPVGYSGELEGILPYRAGYEEEDRKAIQTSLSKGALTGVVSTSGLELGIDIGAVDCVVLLGTPPSVQSFWQRFGRVGRMCDGVCVFIDTKGMIAIEEKGLSGYLSKAPERSWLYLGNRYIQYTNALSAAAEVQSSPHFDPTPFKTLPYEFLSQVENELSPSQELPQDLFSLKQRAQSGPQFEFPVRSGIEKSYQVRYRKGPTVYPLGSLSHSQALREAFPGAVYYYMSQPHRVYKFDFRSGEIDVKREAYVSTKPILQNMVFPKLPHGGLKLWESEHGFLMEAELQVSERVTGFIESRGGNKETHLYNQSSPYSKKPLLRMIETTGVAWYFKTPELMSELVASEIAESFCLQFGIQSRDIGIGVFHCSDSPMKARTSPSCKGICIYDATNGSLRLTEQLADGFAQVVRSTINFQKPKPQHDVNSLLLLACLAEEVDEMHSSTFTQIRNEVKPAEDSEFVSVFAIGQTVLYRMGNGDVMRVVVKGYRYTPAGLMYQLKGDIDLLAKAELVYSEADDAQVVLYNLFTGDIRKK